jgi:hypothetical protein
MRRREFITLISDAAAWPLVAWAQQSKSFRIDYLAFVPSQDSTIIMQRLQELGYRQDENLEFTYRSAGGRPELLDSLVAELVNTRPDVLVAGFGTLPAKAAKASTRTITVPRCAARQTGPYCRTARHNRTCFKIIGFDDCSDFARGPAKRDRLRVCSENFFGLATGNSNVPNWNVCQRMRKETPNISMKISVIINES